MEPRPVSLRQIYAIITRRCNLECSHCIRSSSPRVSDQGSASDFIRAFELLSPIAPAATMLISGGEPCIHPDFHCIVGAASSLFPRVVVNTNGLFAGRLLEAATDFRCAVQVSLDGPQASHDAIRGDGTFEKTLGCIATLSAAGVNVTVATTVSAINIDGLARLDAALTGLGFARWTIQREVVYGRANRSAAVSTSRWNHFVGVVSSSFANRHRIRVRSMYASVDAQNAPVPHLTAEQMLWANCGTGRSKLYINPDLTCFPCGCLEEVLLGDLKVCGASDIIRALQGLPVGDPASDACKTCRFLEACRGGCPGAAYNYFGDFRAGDPRCPRLVTGIPTYPEG
jgi:radical SAM protein with 4Fe4S-binding SPASM domain